MVDSSFEMKIILGNVEHLFRLLQPLGSISHLTVPSVLDEVLSEIFVPVEAHNPNQLSEPIQAEGKNENCEKRTLWLDHQQSCP